MNNEIETYIFFFDQEPIHLNIHMATFDEVLRRNADLHGAQGKPGVEIAVEMQRTNGTTVPAAR